MSSQVLWHVNSNQIAAQQIVHLMYRPGTSGTGECPQGRRLLQNTAFDWIPKWWDCHEWEHLGNWWYLQMQVARTARTHGLKEIHGSTTKHLLCQLCLSHSLKARKREVCYKAVISTKWDEVMKWDEMERGKEIPLLQFLKAVLGGRCLARLDGTCLSNFVDIVTHWKAFEFRDLSALQASWPRHVTFTLSHTPPAEP